MCSHIHNVDERKDEEKKNSDQLRLVRELPLRPIYILECLFQGLQTWKHVKEALDELP